MNPSTTDLTLNMQLPNIATVAWAVQGDTLSRQITATLVDGSTAWNPQVGYLGVIRFFKPDGTNGVYDTDEGGNPAVTWSGNVATVKIAQQCLAVPGTVLMSLEFYDTNDARISAFGWAMNVQPSAVTDDEFLSTDYYNILAKQIAGVLGASSHPPYINSVTKNWMIWDENVNDYVDSGYSSVGATGPYFTPAVDAAGDISWTNNGGLPNPTTQNIKGPQGVSITSTSKASGTGAPGTTDVYDVNLSNGTVAGQFNVYNGADGQGSPGSQTPLMDGAASAGSATAYSREDHIHPTDSSRASAASLAIVEAGATASDTYQNGTYIDWQGTLYTVINGPIAQGTSFVVGTNLQAVPDGAANDLKNTITILTNSESINTGITGLTARKCGNLVIIRAYDFKPSNYSNIGALPSSLYPIEYAIGTLYEKERDGAKRINVNTSGVVIINGTNNSNYLYGEIIYFTA